MGDIIDISKASEPEHMLSATKKVPRSRKNFLLAMNAPTPPTQEIKTESQSQPIQTVENNPPTTTDPVKPAEIPKVLTNSEPTLEGHMTHYGRELTIDWDSAVDRFHREILRADVLGTSDRLLQYSKAKSIVFEAIARPTMPGEHPDLKKNLARMSSYLNMKMMQEQTKGTIKTVKEKGFEWRT